MPRTLAAGESIGHYVLEDELGRGGMGVVFLAHDTRLDRRVALKVLEPELSEDVTFRARFAREMKIAASAEHPNIVPVYEASLDTDPAFIAMRYIDGDDLRTVLDRHSGTGLDSTTAARLALQLGAALDDAHAHGLVHRDVKPGNVLIAGRPDEPHLYLSDFGLAREASSDSGLTNTGQWMGTIDYVAPEQLDGGLISARTDIYAMGCLLYELVTGSVPYAGTVARKLFAHTSEPFPSVGATGGAHAAAIDAVLSRASAKDPSSRFASAGDLARAFAAALRGERTERTDRTVATGVALAGMRASLDGVEAPAGDRTVLDLSPLRRRVPAPPHDPPPTAVGTKAPDRRRIKRAALAVAVALVAIAGVGVAILVTGASDESGDAAATRVSPAQTATIGEASAAIIEIGVAAPADGATIDDDHVLLRGTVSPSNAAVTVQGRPVTVGNGVFRAEASLRPGKNTIDVIASADGAAPTSQSIVVRRPEHQKRSSVVRTVTQVAEVPSPATVAPSTFHAPSGNVSCRVTADSATCTVVRIGMTFRFSGRAPAESILSAALGRGAGQLVDWGQSVSVGDVTCTVPAESQARGITCTDAVSGHGFEASRVPSRQKLY
jgi:tRNA A-37 threonylcarbamoyl transferase component Bud32